MRADFIIGERPMSHAEFLEFVNGADCAFRAASPGSLRELAQVLGVALANDCDVSLFDADLGMGFGESGARDLPVAPAGAALENPARFESVEALLSKLKVSKSKISLFTSGTTGKPKRVSHLAAALAGQARAAAEDCVWAFAYNPAHMAGIQVFFQILFGSGAAVDVFGKPAGYARDKILECGVTHISATPTFYRMLAGCGDVFASVRRATLGGERSSEQMCALVARLFPNARVTNVYATTEAGALLASHGEAFRIPEALVGRVKVAGGELLVSASLLGESDCPCVEGGFFATGDLVEWVDEPAGLFRFVSRKDGAINVGGYKVAPEEVEEALNSVSGVIASRVYGRRNSLLGNVLCADVKLADGISLSERLLRAELSKRLSAFKIPRIINFTAKIKLTRSGKVERR